MVPVRSEEGLGSPMAVTHHVGAGNLGPLELWPVFLTSEPSLHPRSIVTNDTPNPPRVNPGPFAPQPLATTNLLFPSTDVFILDVSYK